MAVDKPNLVLPLAASYNVRGEAGYTGVYTTGNDQRKINSIYEPIHNAATGKTTLYLAKRPGVVNLQQDAIGNSAQVAYLIQHAPPSGSAFLPSTIWLFVTRGGNVRAADTNLNDTVIVASTDTPAYVDKTAISGVETVVLQLKAESGGANTTVWYATAIGSWTQITDADFTGLAIQGKMEHIDGWALALDSLNRIYNSDLNSISSWPAGSYITKQIVQDKPMGLAKFGNQILAFGMETYEVFVNAGNPSGSPLKTVPERAGKVGIPLQTLAKATHYYATLGNKMYFVGRESGQLSYAAYAYDGAQCNKVSSLAIDKILSEAGTFIYSVNDIQFQGKRAVAFGIDPTTAATQRWLMYFPDWNDWFEWNSTVFTPVNSGAYHIGVGSNQHKVYALSSTADNWQDAGTDYTMSHIFKLPTDGNYRKFMPMCGVVGDTARAASTLNVAFSDDDYQTFSSNRAIDMTSGQKMLTRCGSYRDRAVRLTHTGNLDCRMQNFVARVE